MTTPTEAEIRVYMETYMADWSIADEPRILEDLKSQSDGFELLIESEHVTDDDFHVWGNAQDEELDALVPAMSAVLRPFIIEAQVRAAVRFFEHYPDAPLAKRPVSVG
jgi:hypothetical protein